MIITQETLDALRVTFNAQFQQAFDTAEPWWSKIATELPSSNGESVYGWIAQQLSARQWIGPRIAQNLVEREYVLPNLPWEATAELERDKVEDDNLGVFAGQTMPQLGKAMAKIPDHLIADILQNNTTGFDGEDFFSTTHPVYDDAGSLYSNLFTTNPLDPANFSTTWATMAAYNGEDGDPLGINPNLIIVPPQLKRSALEIVNATYMVGAHGSNVTAENVLQGWADVLVIPELSNEPDTWYLADVSRGIMPFIRQLRRAPEFVAKDSPTDDNVFRENKFIYGGYERSNVGVSLPFLISRNEAA